jgi:hypothetical protein
MDWTVIGFLCYACASLSFTLGWVLGVVWRRSL